MAKPPIPPLLHNFLQAGTGRNQYRKYLYGGYSLEYLHSQLDFPSQEFLFGGLGCWCLKALELKTDVKQQGGSHFPQYSWWTRNGQFTERMKKYSIKQRKTAFWSLWFPWSSKLMLVALPPSFTSYPYSCQCIPLLHYACLNGCLLLAMEKDSIDQLSLSWARGKGHPSTLVVSPVLLFCFWFWHVAHSFQAP